MLACLSPLKAHAEESLNTLHFASMALRIKVQPIVMMDPQVSYYLISGYHRGPSQQACQHLQCSSTRITLCPWMCILVVHDYSLVAGTVDGHA